MRACLRPRGSLVSLENARKLYLPVSKVIPTRMHNHMHNASVYCVCEDSISFTSIDAHFKRLWQVKGTVYRC